jgi:hypothetical protein
MLRSRSLTGGKRQIWLSEPTKWTVLAWKEQRQHVAGAELSYGCNEVKFTG